MVKTAVRLVVTASVVSACRPTPSPEPPTPDGPHVVEEPEPVAPTEPVESHEPAPNEPVANEPAPVVEAEVPPPGFVPIPGKRKGKFPGIAFTTVRGFAFDLQNEGRPTCEGPLDPDGTPCATVAKPGVVLSAEQVDRLLALLARKTTWGDGSKCFLPHHGFVFYDAAEVPIAELSVCLLCDMMTATPTIAGARRVDGRLGLSEGGTAELRGLCRELGLPGCDAKTPDELAPPR